MMTPQRYCQTSANSQKTTLRLRWPNCVVVVVMSTSASWQSISKKKLGMSTSGVEKALDSRLKNGTLSQFCHDGKWSPAFKDSDQTFAQQMAKAMEERTAGLSN